MESENTLDAARPEGLDAMLAYLRFWLAMGFTAVWTVGCFSFACVGLLLPQRQGRRVQFLAARTWASGILWAARCPVEVERLAPPPQGTGFLYFSNHSSILDILALFVALSDTPFVFAAKRELFKIPFIGWHLRLAGFVEVDRDNRDRVKDAYARAAQQIRDEQAVVTVYPEGTRSLDGTVLPFKKGAFVLALEAQVPIVPVAVDGAQLALKKYTLRLYGHPIRVMVGAPISVQGLGLPERDELLRKTRLAVLALHQRAGGVNSPLEPMIAPPGKRAVEKSA